MTFKRYRTWMALIIILFLLAFWRLSYFTSDSVVKVKDFSAGGGMKEKNPARMEKFSKTGEVGQHYFVKRVIDGDTIELEGGERVRYIGIDTPETVDPRKPVQCFGKEATRANKELVEGKSVRLEKDVSDRDKYGRLLKYVYQGDIFINLELVKNGYAYAYTYPPDVKNSKIFLEAQKKAREARLGLWGACSQKI